MSDDVTERAQWAPPEWTMWGRRRDAGDPLETPYAWITDEVSDTLSRITLGETRKRRTTILMMADAVASGTREISDVLADERTLGHAGWYQRIRGDENFEEVYKICLARAQAWYDQLENRRLYKRAMRVEMARDEIVSLTEEALQVMAKMLLDDDVPSSIRHRIAVDILDRASEETAAKIVATIRPGESAGPSMRDIRGRKPRPIEDIAGQVSVQVGAEVSALGDGPEEEGSITVEAEADGTVEG